MNTKNATVCIEERSEKPPKYRRLPAALPGASARHKEVMKYIACLLDHYSDIEYVSDHGFGCRRVYGARPRLKINLGPRRPDFILRIRKRKYALEVKIGSVFGDIRIVEQLKAFTDAKARVILVVAPDEIGTLKYATFFCGMVKPWKAICLEDLEPLLRDLVI